MARGITWIRMKVLKYLLMILMLFGSWLTALALEPDIQELCAVAQEKAGQSTAIISVYKSGVHRGGRSWTTLSRAVVFYARNGSIEGFVSALHPLIGMDSAFVEFRGTQYRVKQILKRDPFTDLALLDVELPSDIVPLEISHHLPTSNTILGSFYLGTCYLDTLVGLTSTKYTMPNGTIVAIDVIELRGTTTRGQSGTPLFDSEGKVVGMKSFLLQFRGGAVAGQDILDLLLRK